MSVPLPARKTPSCQNNNKNQGLYFNKFFDQWREGFGDIEKSWRDRKKEVDYYGGKMNWILAQFHVRNRADGKFRTNWEKHGQVLSCGNDLQICGAVKKKLKLVNELGGKIREFATTGPFITGMGLSNPIENGFLWHHTLGVPYLPGSSIKGLLRAWATEWEGVEDDIITRLFGGDDKAPNGTSVGSIIIFDALPVEKIELYCEVITPHDDGWRIKVASIDNAPSDWKSPNPIPFLAIKEGAKFQFALAPRKGAETGDLDLAFELLEAALEWIGAGAKTSVGFGRFLSEKNLEHHKELAKQEEKARALSAIEAIKNWIPDVGEIVSWASIGEDVRVLSIDGKSAEIEFIDDGMRDSAPLADLKKK